MTERLATCSVIIPTRNRAALTLRAVESVLASVPSDDQEVIIVDDDSTDGSMQALSERFVHSSRVRLLSLPRNSGPSAARNAGLAAATGDLILFLDSDDRLLPHALACACAAFRAVPRMQFVAVDGDCVTVSTGHRSQHAHQADNLGWKAAAFRNSVQRTMRIESPDVKGPACTLALGDFHETYLYDDLFFLSGTVIRRRAALAIGGLDERFWWCEDWDFMARLSMIGPGGYLDRTGFVREIGRADQLTKGGTPWRIALMRQRILANLRAIHDHYERPSKTCLRRAQAAADYRLGRCLLDYRHFRLGRRYLARALRAGHKPLKTLILLAGNRHVSALAHRWN